jgi:cytochrome c oxidase cbb3-type subunit 2
MPGFPWFEENMVDGQLVQKKMQRLKAFGGDPYTDEEIASAPADVEGKNEMDAMIAYLQALGHARSGR